MTPEEDLTPPSETITSDEIGKLAEALALAQTSMENPVKDKTNPFFKAKYADLASCLTAAKKALAPQGIALVQATNGTNQMEVKVTTILLHKSGQWIKSTTSVTPTKKDPQGIGSALTYARRYSLSALVGIAGDDDDDGNHASHPQNKATAPVSKSQKTLSTTKPKKETPSPTHGRVSEAQIKRLFALSNECGWAIDEVKEYLKIRFKLDSTKDLTLEQYGSFCTYVQQNDKTNSQGAPA